MSVEVNHFVPKSAKTEALSDTDSDISSDSQEQSLSRHISTSSAESSQGQNDDPLHKRSSASTWKEVPLPPPSIDVSRTCDTPESIVLFQKLRARNRSPHTRRAETVLAYSHSPRERRSHLKRTGLQDSKQSEVSLRSATAISQRHLPKPESEIQSPSPHSRSSSSSFSRFHLPWLGVVFAFFAILAAFMFQRHFSFLFAPFS